MKNEKMPFLEHLSELRRTIAILAAGVGAGFLVSFFFSEKIFGILTVPLRYDVVFKPQYPFAGLLPKGAGAGSLVFLAPAEAFWMHMKISLVAGGVLSSPLTVYLAWKFVSPGLLEREKKYAVPFVLATCFLFALGALFCFIVILPFAMKFLLNYKTEHLTPMISVGNYVDFTLKFILAFGAVFELPLVLVFLTRTGVVSPDALAAKRKYAVLFAFVAAAVLTPTPDAFNQTLMAVPIMLLYECGILASRVFSRRPKDG